MYTMSLTSLSSKSYPSSVGLFITLTPNTMVDDPPPSRLYAVSAPRDCMTCASSSSDSPSLNGSSVKTGLNIGVAAGTQLTYRAPLFLETGLYYSQKGGKSGSGEGKFTYDLNYLKVPLLIKYKHFVGNQTSIQPYAGGYLAVGTDGDIKNYGSRTAFSSFDNGYFNRFDGGLKIGCGVGFNMLYLDASYDIGLANIGQDNFNDTHNGCFTINLGVNF